jgi:hypothetical protein
VQVFHAEESLKRSEISTLTKPGFMRRSSRTLFYNESFPSRLFFFIEAFFLREALSTNIEGQICQIQ